MHAEPSNAVLANEIEHINRQLAEHAASAKAASERASADRGRLYDKMDALLAEVRRNNDAHEKAVAAQAKRIDAWENKSAGAKFVATLVAGFLTTLGGAIGALVALFIKSGGMTR
jgi:hypothetical protein